MLHKRLCQQRHAQLPLVVACAGNVPSSASASEGLEGSAGAVQPSKGRAARKTSKAAGPRAKPSQPSKPLDLMGNALKAYLKVCYVTCRNTESLIQHVRHSHVYIYVMCSMEWARQLLSHPGCFPAMLQQGLASQEDSCPFFWSAHEPPTV